MNIFISKNTVLFRTQFSEKYDLVQKFRGVQTALTYNSPFDFAEAGLIRRDKWDCWHTDVPFAISTDEAAPCRVNKEQMGGNHGRNDAVLIRVENHGKTIADIGSLWKDESGTVFTLLRIVSDEHLMFISENVGPSEDNYKFVREISGSLSYLSDGENTSPIPPSDEQSVTYLAPAVRYMKKQVFAFKDGTKKLVVTHIECDYAQILEEYEIINPATVAPALNAARPSGGFSRTPNLADFGKPMILYSMIYHILADGTVLCEFNYNKLTNVHFETCMGAMYQEKLDVYGGGIWRCLPKTLPFTAEEGNFDFSVPTSIAPGNFPKSFRVTKEYWENPELPPDRVVDYFRDNDEHDRLGFACGYLPVYDGKPEKRRENLTYSTNVYRTRKYYPIFMNGELDTVHGIMYKKYFTLNTDRASVYTIQLENKTYVYMDFFDNNVLNVPVKNNVTLFEKSPDVKYKVENGILTAESKHGYAVFTFENN